MTICIAARCDKSQNCVVAADRELTVGVPMNIAFEHHERKIESVSKACLVLSSGNALIAEAVTTRARSAMAGAGQVEFPQMADPNQQLGVYPNQELRDHSSEQKPA